MCFAMLRVFFIKDLKDLENGTTRFSIDIKDLKDLKRPLDDGDRRVNASKIYGFHQYVNFPTTVESSSADFVVLSVS